MHGTIKMLECGVLCATMGLSACGPDDPMGGSGGGGGAGACPAPRSGPTYHEGDVLEAEVWLADGSPHVVPSTLTLYAKVSVEPCARVEVEEGVAFRVDEGGTLEARGDAERLITFTAFGSGAWGPLLVEHPGSADLSHVTIQKGGFDTGTFRGCALVGSAPNEAPVQPTLRVEQVRVEGSAGFGVCLLGGAAFAEGSLGLTVRGSGASAEPELAHAVALSSAALGTFPEGEYVGNARDAILVDPYLGVPSDVHVKDRGVPYDIDYGTGLGLQVGGDAGPATLTIDPGVSLRFDADASLVIADNGVLVAEGTASDPVTFTSSAAAPAAGDWIGIYFEGPPAQESRVSNAVIEHAGGPCSCTGYSCESDSYPEDAAVEILGWKPSGSFITDSTIRSSAGHGINRGWDSDEPVPDFAASNSFSDLALCAQTTPRPLSRECELVSCP